MAGRWFAVAALASAALAASSPKSLKSDVTVIVDNDLRGQTDTQTCVNSSLRASI